MWLELGALTKGGKTLGVKSFHSSQTKSCLSEGFQWLSMQNALSGQTCTKGGGGSPPDHIDRKVNKINTSQMLSIPIESQD
jgi:hypothetical protein